MRLHLAEDGSANQATALMDEVKPPEYFCIATVGDLRNVMTRITSGDLQETHQRMLQYSPEPEETKRNDPESIAGPLGTIGRLQRTLGKLTESGDDNAVLPGQVRYDALVAIRSLLLRKEKVDEPKKLELLTLAQRIGVLGTGAIRAVQEAFSTAGSFLSFSSEKELKAN